MSEKKSPEQGNQELIFDVAIVGGGLVGQALAAALQPGSLRVAIIDPVQAQEPPVAKQLPDYDLRVSALTARTQNLLVNIGAWQKIPQAALGPYTAMKVWDGEGTGDVEFEAADIHASCLGHIVENRQVLWALQQVLAETEVTFVRQSARYLDNQNDEGYTPVGLESGDRVLARLVVGADGALSRVRQWAGLATREWEYRQQAIIATVECEQPLQATAWQRFRQQGPLAFLPLANNPQMASIVWSTTPQEAEALMDMDEQAFNQELAHAFENRLGKVMASSQRVAIPLRQRHAREYGCEGVALAGDAAHSIHPLAGQGVNLGFKDAEVLAEEILRAHSRGMSISSGALVKRYQRRRESDNLLTMATMEGFKQLFSADAPLLRLLRNEGMRLFNRAPMLKHQVIKKAMGLR